jgi:hypothetical protein
MTVTNLERRIYAVGGLLTVVWAFIHVATSGTL